MQVRVPIMIQDPALRAGRGGELPLVEHMILDRDDVFLDGPIISSLAVLDFDPESGELLPGAPFVPPRPGRKRGSYAIADENQLDAHDFMQVSVFATVLKMMQLFEEPDVLGRALTWAFGAPQLLVVPVAGTWANAFYERDSHSLQFFRFASGRTGTTVYTCLSQDIVAHETTHAILDGIAPDLYDSVTPQCLALHEAVADLGAAIAAFRSRTLREAVLNQTGGSIQDSSAFSSIAEEFGSSTNPLGSAGYLRSLHNRLGLRDVPRQEPHELSQVLSGALYSVMLRIHEKEKRKRYGSDRSRELSVSGEALGVGSSLFKRMIFRALDYLPPGEVSFADYGRAILAADQAAHPADTEERGWIAQEFVNRGIVSEVRSLAVQTNYPTPALRDLDPEDLLRSDWVAYDFANRNRDLLHIPPDIPFQVKPRLDTTKRYYHAGGRRQPVRECLLKVKWDETEPNPLGAAFPPRRRVSVGTTLAIDWESHMVRSILTSQRSQRAQEHDEQCRDRDLLLQTLVERGLLVPEARATGPDGQPLRSLLKAESASGLMRVRGAARLLHIIGEA